MRHHVTKRVEPTSTALSGCFTFSAISFILGLLAVAVAHPQRWPSRTMKAVIQHPSLVPRGQCPSRGALPRRVQAVVAGAWVGNRVWEDGFGNWERSRLRHTTCRVKRRGGYTSNSAFSGVSGFKGFKPQRLGTFVGFSGQGCEGDRVVAQGRVLSVTLRSGSSGIPVRPTSALHSTPVARSLTSRPPLVRRE